jgi:hypothetical protein
VLWFQVFSGIAVQQLELKMSSAGKGARIMAAFVAMLNPAWGLNLGWN